MTILYYRNGSSWYSLTPATFGLAASSHTHSAADITSGTFSTTDNRLPNTGTSGTYGPTSNASVSNGGSFSVPYIYTDATGRVTSAATRTVTIPTYSASSTSGITSFTLSGNSPITTSTSGSTITVNHATLGSASSVGLSSATTGTAGGAVALPYYYADAYGHLTTKSTVNLTFPKMNRYQLYSNGTGSVSPSFKYNLISYKIAIVNFSVRTENLGVFWGICGPGYPGGGSSFINGSLGEWWTDTIICSGNSFNASEAGNNNMIRLEAGSFIVDADKMALRGNASKTEAGHRQNIWQNQSNFTTSGNNSMFIIEAYGYSGLHYTS